MKKRGSSQQNPKPAAKRKRTQQSVTIGMDLGDKDIVFDNVRFDAALGEPLVLDNASVKWNGAAKSGSSGGKPDVFC